MTKTITIPFLTGRVFLLCVLLLTLSQSARCQLKVSADGNVAVGSLESPSSSLTVGGIGDRDFKAYISGDTRIVGKLNVNTVNLDLAPLQSSILRMQVGQVLDLISQLNPYKYLKDAGPIIIKSQPDEIDSYSKTIDGHFALNAHEIKQLFPTLTSSDGSGKLLVDQGQLLIVLIQAIKELKERIDALNPSSNNLLMAASHQAFNNEETDRATSSISTLKDNCKLYQNAPNPFSEQTSIRFVLPDNTHNAYIYIFDMTGKLLRQIPIDSSMSSIDIHGYELTPGMYIYSLIIGGKEIDTKKMILSK